MVGVTLVGPSGAFVPAAEVNPRGSVGVRLGGSAHGEASVRLALGRRGLRANGAPLVDLEKGLGRVRGAFGGVGQAIRCRGWVPWGVWKGRSWFFRRSWHGREGARQLFRWLSVVQVDHSDTNRAAAMPIRGCLWLELFPRCVQLKNSMRGNKDGRQRVAEAPIVGRVQTSFVRVEPRRSWAWAGDLGNSREFGFDALGCEHRGKPGLGLDAGKVEFRAPTSSGGEHPARLVFGNRRLATPIRWARYPKNGGGLFRE